MGIKKKALKHKFFRAWTILFFLVLSLSGCFSSKEEVGAEKEKDSYGWCSYGNAPFEDGVLALTGRVWVFDRETEQMVPLCTRPECSHEYFWSAAAKESDCPASYLGRRAAALAVYEGKIWYVYQNEGIWEFWTAELDGENHSLRQKAEMGVLTPGPESLFYDGFYYTVATDLTEDPEAGEFQILNRLVRVDLETGEVKELTEPVDVSENPTLLGVYGDWLYYTQVVTDETGKLVRNIYQLSQETGEAELLDRGSWCGLNGPWLAYVAKRDNGRGEICLRDLETGETKGIYEVEIEKFTILHLSGGKLLWMDPKEDTEDYTCRIYQIEEDGLAETAHYQKPYSTWLKIGDGWLISAQAEEVTPSTSPDDYVEYFYIKEKDLLAGEEPKQVK